MGIVKDRGRYYRVKRVPKRFVGLVRGKNGQAISQVRQALRTDGKAEAQAKAAQVEVAKMAEWEAIAAGDSKSARKHFEAARKLAEARGFKYRTLDALLNAPINEVLGRVKTLGSPNDLEAREVVQAVLGTVPVVLPDLRGVLEEYFDLTCQIVSIQGTYPLGSLICQ